MAEAGLMNEYTHTSFGRVGTKVCRLGLSATYRPGKAIVHKALDAGVNLLFCYGFDSHLTKTVRELPASRRDGLFIITGGYNLLINRRPNLQKVLDKRLKQLGTDRLDAFMFLGVSKPKHLSPWTMDALHELKQTDKVRHVGISCHDRKFVGQLAADGVLDVLMIRYNAAHRGGETEIFPHLATHDPGVVGYTATRWRDLLRRPRGWPKDGRIPSASMCYRFVLSNPHIHVCLTAPSNDKHLTENLRALEQGPLSEEDLQFMREFGDVVHKKRKLFG